MSCYKSCGVPMCGNTSIKTPNKLFINVPKMRKRRLKWLRMARRDLKTSSPNSTMVFCEDHFELPKDMENYMQYKIMGSIRVIRMRKDCVPTKFHCQPDRLSRMSTIPSVDKTAHSSLSQVQKNLMLRRRSKEERDKLIKEQNNKMLERRNKDEQDKLTQGQKNKIRRKRNKEQDTTGRCNKVPASGQIPKIPELVLVKEEYWFPEAYNIFPENFDETEDTKYNLNLDETFSNDNEDCEYNKNYQQFINNKISSASTEEKKKKDIDIVVKQEPLHEEINIKEEREDDEFS